MNFFLRLTALALALALCLQPMAVLAQAEPALPTRPPGGGVPLIDGARLEPGQLRVRLGAEPFATSQVQPVEHPAFEHSLKLDVTRRPPNTWDLGASAVTTAPVKKDDALLVGFWARGKAADGNGGGVAEFVFEKNRPPHTKSVQYLVETPIDGEWRHFWVRFRALEDYAPGEATINFQAGYTETTFEIAALEAWNYFDRVPLEELPYTALTYAGRENDAPWRVEAARRIDRHRKADLKVTVLDANGQPLAGVPVQVHLDRHDFVFGSAAKAEMLVGEGPDHDRYRETFQRLFNLAVIENGLKWKMWDARPDRQARTIEALHWLKQHKISVRGHVMVWPGYRHLPDWFPSLEDKPDKLRQAIDAHIREVASAAGDLVREWDVLNEVYANRDLTNILGDEAMGQWFRVAREAAPHARRYYNDYAGLVRGGYQTTHKDHFEKTLRYLIDEGAPIDGMGIQGHFGSLLTPPGRLYAELDHWASLGLGILITEFDVTVPDENLRADFTRDFLTVCFSHPAVEGVVTWGFWEGAQWKPASALFATDWDPTPMGRQWIELTTKTWQTNETKTTDARGQVQLRAFLGDYTVSAATATKTFHHAKPGTDIKLVVGPESE